MSESVRHTGGELLDPDRPYCAVCGRPMWPVLGWRHCFSFIGYPMRGYRHDTIDTCANEYCKSRARTFIEVRNGGKTVE